VEIRLICQVLRLAGRVNLPGTALASPAIEASVSVLFAGGAVRFV
jgi:hypothetical protein